MKLLVKKRPSFISVTRLRAKMEVDDRSKRIVLYRRKDILVEKAVVRKRQVTNRFHTGYSVEWCSQRYQRDR